MKKAQMFCMLTLACIAVSCGGDPKKTDNSAPEVNPETTMEKTKTKVRVFGGWAEATGLCWLPRILFLQPPF